MMNCTGNIFVPCYIFLAIDLRKSRSFGSPKGNCLIDSELIPWGREIIQMKLAIPVQENGGLPHSSSGTNFSNYQHQTGQIQKISLMERKDVSVVIPLLNEEES